MKRMVTFAALILALVAGLVTAQSGQNPMLVQYAGSNPSGTCLPGYSWVNTVTDVLWVCDPSTNPPHWISTIGGVSTGFPITATSGATTVTLTGNAVAATGSYSIFNATEGAGWNTALGGTLGASLFAFNPSKSVTLSLQPNATNTMEFTQLNGSVTSSLLLGPSNEWTMIVTAPGGSGQIVVDPTDVVEAAINTSNQASASTLHAASGSVGYVQRTVDDAFGLPAFETLSPYGLALPYAGNVSSSGTITPRGNVYKVTGTNTISTITIPAVYPEGVCHVLIFTSTASVDEAGNIKLSTSPFSATADDTLTLCTDGTSWYETARSVN